MELIISFLFTILFLAWVTWVFLYWAGKVFRSARKSIIHTCPKCGTQWDFEGHRPDGVINRCEDCCARFGFRYFPPEPKREKGWGWREIEAERLLEDDDKA